MEDSTEQKIIAVAKRVFTRKGYAAARIRDIAAEAEINISLVNYYFRSKEKLFEIVMLQNLDTLFSKVGPLLNDEKTDLKEKVRLISGHYIDMLVESPDLASFIMNEVMSGQNKIPSIAQKKKFIVNSYFARQVFALRAEGKIRYHPLQLTVNLVGMILTPFLASSMLAQFGLSGDDFAQLVEERKRLIPDWFDSILKT
ncbi:MAG TPA: TetR/AcrR family transcriptional regulator [Mucilaginibacter sp.]|nr:TetR/AcrR family transcriptional regulator [Mucilaginibacter sp.]